REHRAAHRARAPDALRLMPASSFRRLGALLVALCAAALLGAWGCAPAAAPPPHPPPRPATRPGSVPADLDVVVRVDVVELMETLGPELTRRALGDTVLGPDPTGLRPLLARALAQTRVLWLAWRSGPPIGLAAKVLSFSGRFTDLAERARATPDFTPY